MANPPRRQRGNDAGPIAESVAANVAARRQMLGLTRQELADRLESAGRRFTPDAVQKLEANGRRCDVDDLVALATALDAAPGDLLGIGAAERRSTVRDVDEFARRNPVLVKGVQVAVVLNGESRKLLLDCVDTTARTMPEWDKFFRNMDDLVASVRVADDDEAARLLLADLAVSALPGYVYDTAALAQWVGKERAKPVREAMVRQVAAGVLETLRETGATVRDAGDDEAARFLLDHLAAKGLTGYVYDAAALAQWVGKERAKPVREAMVRQVASNGEE